MPKLAREYNRWNNTTISHNKAEICYTRYYYETSEQQYRRLREANRPKRKPKKKLNSARFSFSLTVMLLIMIFVMPFSMSKINQSIFNPTPYKNIKIDMNEFAFPTHKYLSNAWFMDRFSFRFAEDGKNAKMMPLKENVNMPVLKSELQNLISQFPTVKPAIYVWDYDTQNYVDINGSKIYATASIIKIPILIDLFKSIEAGQVSLDDSMTLSEIYRTEGSGSLQFKAENSKYSIDKLAEVMITESDNSATNMLMSKIGSMTGVNQSIRDWGIKNTEIHTWLPDYKGTNYTTAKDMAQMLYNIDENNEFLTETSRNKIFNYMNKVHNNRLIHAGLGKGSVFLHKTGDIGTMLGDAGIVIAPNGKKYIVVILANRPHNSIAGKNFIVRASEIIYNYMVR